MSLSKASDDARIFEQVASALTVKPICSPFEMDIPAGSTVSDLPELFSDRAPKQGPFRVIAPDGSTKGIASYSHLCSLGERTEDEETEDDEPDYDDTETIDEIMDQLEPCDLVSSATTILEAVELFARTTQPYFCVIHVNEIIGILSYEDLFKPLGRLAFLALALEIEHLALLLCCSSAKQAWNALSDGRKRKAIDLFKLRHNRDPSFEDNKFRLKPMAPDIEVLIGYTQLADKATMIWKLKLIQSGSRSEILGFFHDLMEIRDRCAHPVMYDRLALVAKDRLAAFVTSAVGMRAEIAKALGTNRVTGGVDLSD
jgi:hypothetical protein